MASVMACAKVATEVTTGATGRPRAGTPSCCTTTLYDLITALQAVGGPDGDALVVTTVVDLLQSGRLTWGGKGRARLAEARGPGNSERRDGRQASRLAPARQGLTASRALLLRHGRGDSLAVLPPPGRPAT